MIDNSPLLSTYSLNNENSRDDLRMHNLQENLIRMGFDITMINKIISIYKIKTESEALDYLIKTDDGMWNHPFIPRLINQDDNNDNILQKPKTMVNNVLTRINSFGISKKAPNIIQDNNLNSEEINIDEDICEICGESKDIHKIKEYIAPNNENNLNNNNILNINNINNNYNKNDDENLLLLNNDNNEINTIINDKTQNEIKKEEENENPNECPICMGDFENPIEIENCKHKFCQECFNSYLVNLINHNRIDEIPCPKKNCSNKKLTEEFFSQYLSEQEYFKFRQFKSQNEIARDAKKIFCPLCDSYASIEGMSEQYDSNSPNYKKSTLKCQNGHEFCSCGRPLHENECYHDNKEFQKFLNQEKIKKCPKCGFLIKKNKGCNHMTCGNPICRYEFCWLCMKEAVPNHFDFGPCQGKQFFDPESFSYRLQQTHPCLYVIYSLFRCIFTLIIGIFSIFVLPGIMMSFFSYEYIFRGQHPQYLNKKCIKIIWFFTHLYINFCTQSIIYMIWIIIISAILFSVGVGIITFIFGKIIAKLYRLFHFFISCCKRKNNNDIHHMENAVELQDKNDDIEKNLNNNNI